ncbi:MAG: electron transfer flavoprotein subunit alpha/FixB family protein [Actinobacteria bacterium]|nr:electron transfer flavoprotein subunit alpha/FixB family protein [Actinomycetota bacterium]
MSGGANVLAVLVPGVEGRDDASAVLLAEAGRVAHALGGEVTAVGLGPGGGDPSGSGGPFDVEPCVRTLAAHVGALRPRTVLMLDGDLSRELAPRLALACGSSALVGCTGVAVMDGAVTYSKPAYGGWLEEELTYAAGSLEVVTLDRGALSLAAPGATDASTDASTDVSTDASTAGAPVTMLEVGRGAGARAIRHVETRPPDYRTVDIVHAKRIVAVGMGVVAPLTLSGGADEADGLDGAGGADESGADGEGLMVYVEELAALLEASIAATRPVVDEGRLPKERLVGQTGRTVAPELYLALGISGSPHHVAGIQGAETILAVDRDPAAPVFQFADAGYVADLHRVLPALIRRIEEWRDGRD